MKKLTKMQQKVYDYIAQFMTKWGYPPSVREICAELNFKSPSTAHFHILNLEKKGYLEHDAGKGRAIRLKGEAQTAPAVPAAPAAPSNAVDFMEERDARENRIPIVGNVAAGSPILAQECVEDYLTFDTGSRSGEFFALRVRGESMLGVGILPDGAPRTPCLPPPAASTHTKGCFFPSASYAEPPVSCWETAAPPHCLLSSFSPSAARLAVSRCVTFRIPPSPRRMGRPSTVHIRSAVCAVS